MSEDKLLKTEGPKNKSKSDINTDYMKKNI